LTALDHPLSIPSALSSLDVPVLLRERPLDEVKVDVIRAESPEAALKGMQRGASTVAPKLCRKEDDLAVEAALLKRPANT